MKRCPKCNRTFPDDNQKFCTVDGGLLRATDTLFDPNATIQSTTKDVFGEPDMGATVAGSSSAPTVVFPKDTGPTGSTTAGNVQQQPPARSATPPAAAPPPRSPEPQFSETVALPPRAPSVPSPQAPIATAPPVAAPAPVAQKKSKLPLILGILAILLVLGIGGVVAAFFLVIRPRLEQMNESPVVVSETPAPVVNENRSASPSETPTPEVAEFVAPPGTTKFTNSDANLEGALAEHYLDFSFYYPNNWELDPKAGSGATGNFAKVERRLPPDFTQENVAVRWYPSKGTYAADQPDFPNQVEEVSASLAKLLPEYRKVSEGPTKINSLDAYEFRWVAASKGTVKGDLQLWGRVVFVPTGVEGEKTGAVLTMFTTSLAPELSGVEDVGEKGETPIILESFRFEKKR